jgi:hypothetical protein
MPSRVYMTTYNTNKTQGAKKGKKSGYDIDKDRTCAAEAIR